MKAIRVTSPCPLIARRLASVVIAIVFISIPIASLAATNVATTIQAALRHRLLAWGEFDVGTAAEAAPDPRAAGLREPLRALLAQRIPSGVPPALPPRSDAQQVALQRLRLLAGNDLEVHLRAENRTVAQIKGRVARPSVLLQNQTAAERDEQTARHFTRAHRELLLLADPDQELVLEATALDTEGRRHFRFAQHFSGLPVWPSGLSVHLDVEGQVELVDGAYVPTPVLAGIRPRLSGAEAAVLARASVPGGAIAEAGEPELIIHAPLQGEPRLAWKVPVARGWEAAWLVVVDAQDGRVLRRLSQCHDVNVVRSAPDLQGVSRTFNAWSAGGRFYLVDTTKPSFNAAFDPVQNPRGSINIFDARLVKQQQLQTIFLIESTNGNDWLPDGVSAMFNFGLTFDYFHERHGRNSLDGKGGTIQAAVRVAEMDNAFWNGQAQIMVFGNARPYPAALDVVGHELTHGVVQFSADLIYELQPGAMNESFSDIFGEMVEARARGQNDWKLGTELGKVFRDFIRPGSLQIGGLNRPYPSRMSEYVELPNSDEGDHGGVHINSSIINHCFYLLAEGLPEAIGRGDAEKIFYRCLTRSLQKQSQFIDLRLGCIAAAEALFGANSTQARQTAAAFDAVEIFDRPPTPEPPRLPPVQGADSTLLIGFDPFFFVYALGRREAAFGDPNDGVALVESVKVARPSVSGDGTFAVFVDGANDLGVVETDDPNSFQALGVPGLVHSVAMSPDGNQYAFVLRDPTTGTPDNRITVINVGNNTQRTFELLLPVADGDPADLVLNAESMVFSSDGKDLIYDAVSALRFGNGPPVRRWSIFRLHLPTGSIKVLVPPLEGYDTGNPNLGRVGNRYLTFDANDLETGETYIVNLDLFTGEFGTVGAVGDGIGFPCFTGDESAVIYAARDPGAFLTGYSLVRQPLAANRLETGGQPSLWLPDAPIGVIYRRGAFAPINLPPEAALTSPANGATFAAGASISLTAQATDADGTVARVEFYQGAVKLGEDSTPPFEWTWSNVSAGSYRLIARAIDTLGGTQDSSVINITVGSPAPLQLVAGRLASGAIRITVSAPAGNYTLQDSTNLQGWSDAFPVTVNDTGTAAIEDVRVPRAEGRLFYRLRKN